MNADFSQWRLARQVEVETALVAWLPVDTPGGLGAAMRYAVLDGGKRLRPLMALAAAEAVGGQSAMALRAGCAVELIHAYSLVHDDMPCMDNDVLRRGKPTVHVAYGEAQALLVGDALQALAFELLTPQSGEVPDALAARWCNLLARAAGAQGMAGGQAVDLASVGLALDRPALETMHQLKTGALLRASVAMGAATAQQSSTVIEALHTYGAHIGLAFQVMDDVLDVVSDSATLGKTAGKDAAAAKPTYVSLMGLVEARDYAQQLLSAAHQALDSSGLANTRRLRELCDWVGQRAH